MTLDLFASESLPSLPDQEVAPGAWLFRNPITGEIDVLIDALEQVVDQAPLRQMTTPGGYTMSVQTTSCGELGWISDSRGYRYAARDPQSGSPWPAMPEIFAELAQQYAARAGFNDFLPDSCLINRYCPGTRLSLHQDRDERDFTQPILSVSLGLPAVFLFGGFKRSEPTQRLVLHHGDILVWGGVSRMRYHGVLPLKSGVHPLLGEQRINLTFRKAG